MNSRRNYSPLDQLLINLDLGIRTLYGRPKTTGRPNPAATLAEAELTDQERIQVGRLMRINHAGEVSAQGLYQGQALSAKLPKIRQQMHKAALEENDHLAWCAQRTQELGSHVSYLNPLWYVGSLGMGFASGLIGDRWSLGFVVETERQVVRHLEQHLNRLPEQDQKSHAILEQMKVDERHHATTALQAGGAELPGPVKMLMGLISKIMTRTAYWV